jgi:hypothetical protein
MGRNPGEELINKFLYCAREAVWHTRALFFV